MNKEDLVVFIGRFHPLVVHLPIGFLILAFLMWVFQQWKKSADFSTAISFSLLLGTLSAAVACLLGYLLSISGGYEKEMLNTHMWAGISTTMIAGIAYVFHSFSLSWKFKKQLIIGCLFLMMAGLSITGHVGGSLTHGSDYLSAYAPFGEKPEEKTIPETLEQVVLFDHVIRPILDQKCSSCHRSGKQKGELSFENEKSILKGGESGPILTIGLSSESELIKRVSLPESHKKIMPPEGKTPLSELEKQLLISWIDKGANFQAKLLDIDSAGTTNELVISYLGLDNSSNKMSALSDIKTGLVDSLRKNGFVIRELGVGSNQLDVTFPSYALKSNYTHEKVVEDLKLIENNVVWLNLSGLNLNDDLLETMPGFNQLKKLRIDRNLITDRGVASLNYATLEVLNLVGNNVTDESWDHLIKMQNLKKVYVWETSINNFKNENFEIIH